MRFVKILLLIFITTIVCGMFFSTTAYAVESINDGYDDGLIADEIVYFKSLEVPEIVIHKKETLAEIQEILPQYLDAINAENRGVSIPVTWECVGDYEETNYFYYQFKAIVDYEKYYVAENVELPYVWILISQTDFTGRAVTNKVNETLIYEFLVNELECNLATAVGILANLERESGFNPKASVLDSNGLTSYGICQWNGSRFESLKKYCSEHDYDYSSLDAQLKYLKYELNSTEKSAWKKMQGIENTQDGAYTAGYNWARYFERCAAVYREVSAVRARDVYWPNYGGLVDEQPVGFYEEADGGNCEVTVRGWAYDPDTLDQSVMLQVYINDEHIADIIADKERMDVNEVYECGINHGFDSTIPYEVTADTEGDYIVTLYASNNSEGAEGICLGSKTVFIGKKEEEPQPEKNETTAMYRLYNPNSGEHFYTGSIEEKDNLTAIGWIYEGIAWNAPTNGGIPVFRMFNPNSGDHHYTMSQEEVDMLVNAGWIYEGICWNSASEVDLPLYRLYNPNANCGSHHYTGSEEERDYLVSLGWIFEGIGWFGIE